MSSRISINLVVFNGEKYIRHCLDSIKNLNYPHDLIELNIWDNNSTDGTKKIIKDWQLELGELAFVNSQVIENSQNIGMWAGQEKLFEISAGKYVVVLSVDVILDKNFLLEAMGVMEVSADIGALQAKVYRFDLDQLKGRNLRLGTDVIDTCGFKIFKSRRIVNIGHGEKDTGQYNTQKEIFGVEGAVPVFRKEAFASLRIKINPSGAGEIFDHDFFWYAEDLDIAWRMNLFGWKQIYAPRVLAWHDRQTTKSLSGGFTEFRKSRQQIPLNKRRLEWKNLRF
ncbi:MAG: Glycosyl transferase family protein, partial [Candidatus Yanofskybacteria bacterium GW2011_GWE1_40_10]